MYDGTGSRSTESTGSGTGRSKVSVKSQLKRGFSGIRSILGFGVEDSDTGIQHHPEAVFTSTEGSHLGYILGNGSDATTLCQPLRIRLTAMPDAPETTHGGAVNGTVKSMSFTSGANQTIDNDDNSLSEWVDISPSSGQELRRSQSVPGFQRLFTKKLQRAFRNPTVIRRSDLRSRPSFLTFAIEAAEVASLQPSSTPSPVNSGSGSPRARIPSTPMTSAPVTPRSIANPDGVNSFDVDRQTYFVVPRLLTPIPEGAAVPRLSIKTVESAATAKVFFEMHFNSLLNGVPSREVRQRELKTKLEEHHLPASTQSRAQKAWISAETENLRQRRILKNTTNQEKAAKGITIGGFEVVSILGKGSFGVVRLVKAKGEDANASGADSKATETVLDHRASRSILMAPGKVFPRPMVNKKREMANAKKQVFAMKVIRKSDMIRNGQEGHLRAERDFLVAADGSRWIIPLIAAFQDRKHLYLVMEYCIGGDFLGLLIRKNTINEEDTKWYVAEMILCVEEAHRMQWIHRDVKPDNFLISVDGHLKISDFGLAFDGEWCHDQKFFHKNRFSLLDQLGIDVEGDEQDKREKDETGPRQGPKCSPSQPNQGVDANEPFPSRDEPGIGEPVLDWRNRAQRRRLARSIVGTSQYMAPEVIRGEMYDGRCD